MAGVFGEKNEKMKLTRNVIVIVYLCVNYCLGQIVVPTSTWRLELMCSELVCDGIPGRIQDLGPIFFLDFWLSHRCSGRSRGAPNGTQFFRFRIPFRRKAPASDIGPPPQREILDPPLRGYQK